MRIKACLISILTSLRKSQREFSVASPKTDSRRPSSDAPACLARGPKLRGPMAFIRLILSLPSLLAALAISIVLSPISSAQTVNPYTGYEKPYGSYLGGD